MQVTNKIVSSLIWKFLERFGTVGIQFIVQLFLARLLSPSDFGSLAILTVFITVSNVFIQTGFNTALIQKKDTNESDFSSVFYLTIAIATVCYIVLYIAAPHIAGFYNLAELSDALRVLTLVLFVGAYNSIQIAKISKSFKFKELFFSSLIAILISGATGIYLAFQNYGIWALVIQQLLNQIIVTIVLYFETKWIPKLIFDYDRVKALFKFGYKLLISSLIDVIYNNLYNLVIGKVYDSKSLGYYNRADQFPNLIVYNVNGSIQSVILPALSEFQDDKARMKALLRKSMMLSSYLIFPIVLGLSACAKPLVLILLTEKWLPCVPMLKLLCFSYMLWPIHTTNLQAINALGRSDIYLKLEVIKKIIGITALIISIPYGILAMIIMKIVSSVIGTAINSWPNKKLLMYGYIEQMKDLFPSFICSILMYISVELFNHFYEMNFTNLIMQLICDVILGVIIYLALSLITKNENINLIKNILIKEK